MACVMHFPTTSTATSGRVATSVIAFMVTPTNLADSGGLAFVEILKRAKEQ